MKMILQVSNAALALGPSLSSFTAPRPHRCYHIHDTQCFPSPKNGQRRLRIKLDEASFPEEEPNQLSWSNAAEFSSSNKTPVLFSFDWWKPRLPNYLTWFRLILIPVVAYSFYYLPYPPVLTAFLFALAGATDWLDGYLARRWKTCSNFGAFLDPVADKLMVSTTLVLLTGRYGTFVAWPTAVIVAREITISALREWMAQRQSREAVKVSFQGKLKTALTMIAIFALLLLPTTETASVSAAAPGFVIRGLSLPTVWTPFSFGLLYVSAALTVTSGAAYFRAASNILFPKSQGT